MNACYLCVAALLIPQSAMNACYLCVAALSSLGNSPCGFNLWCLKCNEFIINHEWVLPVLMKIKRIAEEICQNTQEILRHQLRISACEAQTWYPPPPLLVLLAPKSHQDSAFWVLPDYSKVGKENLIRWIIFSVSSFHIRRDGWQDWTDSQWLSLVAEYGTPETIFKESLK